MHDDAAHRAMTLNVRLGELHAMGRASVWRVSAPERAYLSTHLLLHQQAVVSRNMFARAKCGLVPYIPPAGQKRYMSGKGDAERELGWKVVC